jgi:hypothetical protein
MSDTPSTALSVREIYAELVAGKKITLSFTSQEDLKNFQSHIRSVRSKMEGTIRGIGYEEENAKDVLRFDVVPVKVVVAITEPTELEYVQGTTKKLVDDGYNLTLWLEPKKYPYTILKVEDA